MADLTGHALALDCGRFGYFRDELLGRDGVKKARVRAAELALPTVGQHRKLGTIVGTLVGLEHLLAAEKDNALETCGRE